MTFTPEQTKELSAKLDGGSVKKRKVAGRDVSYIEGWHAIAEANRIFGFDAWDRETVELRLVAEKSRKIGQGQYEKDGFGVGYIAKVRIIVRADGHCVLRDGTGYGSGIDADLGSAHESAIKEAETDAMKRALMTFGNPFGLALYDKEQHDVERGGNHAAPSPAPKANGTPAPATGQRKPTPGKFELLFPNGETMAKLDDPEQWFDSLRRELKTPGAAVGGLWEKNRRTAEALRDQYPDVMWPDAKGNKFHAYAFVEGVVHRLLPGLAA